MSKIKGPKKQLAKSCSKLRKHAQKGMSRKKKHAQKGLQRFLTEEDLAQEQQETTK